MHDLIYHFEATLDKVHLLAGTLKTVGVIKLSYILMGWLSILTVT